MILEIAGPVSGDIRDSGIAQWEKCWACNREKLGSKPGDGGPSL